MKTGIIIHSRTNNTLSVGEKLLNTLLAQGRTATLERVKAVNEDPNLKENVHLASVPDIKAYDYIVLGAPVEAFSLSPVMKAYLAQLPSLRGKKVALFVTQYFPKAWMGGNRAIKQMVRHVTRLGGDVTNTAIVNWTNKAREEQIREAVVKLRRFDMRGDAGDQA